MSTDLATIFASLVRHHIATPATPLPERTPGITWIWSADGIYKRGVNEHLEALIPVSRTRPIPGLASIRPCVRWQNYTRQRLPGGLLHAALAAALRSTQIIGGLIVPAELQAFVVLNGVEPELHIPPQHAGLVYVYYTLPSDAPIMLDLHSHHVMLGRFSPQDAADDVSAGLSVSAVIGNLFVQPEILVRINIYGDHCIVPALLVFDDLGPFVDGAVARGLSQEETYAHSDG
jgi:hypothetical protein